VQSNKTADASKTQTPLASICRKSSQASCTTNPQRLETSGAQA